MNIVGRVDLMELLAAEYALGTLRGGARRRLEALARDNSGLHERMKAWEARMGNLGELQTLHVPSARVWTNIEQHLPRAKIENKSSPDTAEGAPSESHGNLDKLKAPRGVSKRWRWPALWHPARSLNEGGALNGWRYGACAAGVCAMVALGWGANRQAELQVSQAELSQIKTEMSTESVLGSFVSVLNDESGVPQLVASLSGNSTGLRIERVGSYEETPEKSLQLWAIGADGAPHALGVLGATRAARVAEFESAIAGAQVLAVSLENRGGVKAGQGPQGPVIWKGAWVRRRA